MDTKFLLSSVLCLGLLSVAPIPAVAAESDDLPPSRSNAEGTLTRYPAANGVPEIILINDPDEFISFLEGENWWGEVRREQQLEVPHLIVTAISPKWRERAPSLPVSEKKELFYRVMLPLVMHANSIVMDRRATLLTVQENLSQGSTPTDDQMDLVHNAMTLLKVGGNPNAITADSPELSGLIDDILVKLDIIPPGIALGQAAFESGYGTSRFAAEGNALFGQWTYGGDGMVPEQQRAELGDHRIQAFDWPFDSVRGYFINLMSHPAYDEFRQMRADLRSRGEPLDSLVLADGLESYSERGQEYVNELKGMIRVNKLDVADYAVFRDEPLRFFISEPDPEQAANLRAEIEQLRNAGKLNAIVESMRLD